MPRDMGLHPGNVQGYNNLIQIAGSDVVIGHNPEINEDEPINPASEVDKAFQDGLGAGAGAGALPPPPVSVLVEIALPIAVTIDAMVIPCSQKRSLMRSDSVVSS